MNICLAICEFVFYLLYFLFSFGGLFEALARIDVAVFFKKKLYISPQSSSVSHLSAGWEV